MSKPWNPGPGPNKLAHLLSWLHQWHHAIDPEYHDRLSTIHQSCYDQLRHALCMTDEQIEEVRLS